MRYLALTLTIILAACTPPQQARQQYVENRALPYEVRTAILDGEIIPGMTKEQVRASWGRPDHVQESYYEGVGARTQWCYGGGTAMQCIYFEGGEVTGWN